MSWTAACDNEDCSKEPWTLTKHPDDYARDGPTCPECGTTRVSVEGSGGARKDQGGQGGGEQAVARSDAQRAGTPARQGAGGGGEFTQDVIALMDDDVNTQRKAQGVQGVLGALGDGVTTVMQYLDQKEKMAEQRAEDADLQRVTNKPVCEECGYQFKQLPMTETVVCPDCGAEYFIDG